ncbi:MAG: archease [Actinomycetota bacterium]
MAAGQEEGRGSRRPPEPGLVATRVGFVGPQDRRPRRLELAAGFEILDHTADVGVAAWGPKLGDAFGQATRGLAEIAGIWRGSGGEPIAVEVEADDLGGLLVDWLEEILYLHDVRRIALGGVSVEVEGTRARGAVSAVPLGDDPVDGTQVKAVTYHQLAVEERDDGWWVRVFLDI